MNMDEWLIQQVITHKLISPDDLKEVQRVKATTDLSYEEIILQLKLLQPQQLAMIKNSPFKKKLTSTQKNSVAKTNNTHVSNSFGRFLIEKKLGEGSFGTVFLAYDNEWNRKVALKILKPGYHDDELTIKRFKREVDAIAQLDHPGIIKVYEFDQFNGQSFYTMSYIEGESLQEILKREKKMSPRKAARMIKSVAEILQHAHQHNLIHRDIKPENIMVGKDGQIYLTDFGLAKNTQGSKLSRTGEIMGTPSYMSPEQARGKKIDQQSDIYSLGVTLYELLTGQLPFPGNNTTKILIDIMQKKPIPPCALNATIPVDLEKIPLKCMEKNKEQRYENVEKLIRDIDLFLEGKSIYTASISQKTMNIMITCIVILLIAVCYLFMENNLLKNRINTQEEEIQAQKKHIAENITLLNEKEKTIETLNETISNQEKEIILLNDSGIDTKLKLHWEDYNKAKNDVFKFALLEHMKIEHREREIDKVFDEIVKPAYENYKKLNIRIVDSYKRSYYAPINEEVNWKEAEARCRLLGGHLLCIETFAEWEKVKSMLNVFINGNNNIKGNSNWKHCWIGLYQKDEKDWYWLSDDSKVNYYNWGEGEPNNSGGIEDYVEILNGKVWNDEKKEGRKNYYICEWNLE